MSRAKEGDLEGLHFLYVRYAPDVFRCVTSVVDDHDDAEKITYGVFAGLMTAINEYERREGSFGAWILRVAHNAAMDPHARRRTR